MKKPNKTQIKKHIQKIDLEIAHWLDYANQSPNHELVSSKSILDLKSQRSQLEKELRQLN